MREFDLLTFALTVFNFNYCTTFALTVFNYNRPLGNIDDLVALNIGSTRPSNIQPSYACNTSYCTRKLRQGWEKPRREAQSDCVYSSLITNHILIKCVYLSLLNAQFTFWIMVFKVHYTTLYTVIEKC
jgi:hypothetical protein